MLYAYCKSLEDCEVPVPAADPEFSGLRSCVISRVELSLSHQLIVRYELEELGKSILEVIDETYFHDFPDEALHLLDPRNVHGERLSFFWEGLREGKLCSYLVHDETTEVTTIPRTFWKLDSSRYIYHSRADTDQSYSALESAVINFTGSLVRGEVIVLRDELDRLCTEARISAWDRLCAAAEASWAASLLVDGEHYVETQRLAPAYSPERVQPNLNFAEGLRRKPPMPAQVAKGRANGFKTKALLEALIELAPDRKLPSTSKKQLFYTTLQRAQLKMNNPRFTADARTFRNALRLFTASGSEGFGPD